MNIIVDTSVWSLVLRRNPQSTSPQAVRLVELIQGGQRISLLGVILQELLQGLRSPADFERVKSYLSGLPVISLEPADYIAAAELWNACRSNGVQIGTVDAQIAAACIRHDCALLTDDIDFARIARLGPLVLL